MVKKETKELQNEAETGGRAEIENIFLYIIMQLSRLNWWDDFIKLTEDTQYTDWEDQPGYPDPHYLIVWHNRQ